MNEKQRGIIFILGASFFAALMGIFVNMAGQLPAMQKSFFRNFFALLIAFGIHKSTHKGFYIEKSCCSILLIRCIAGSLGLMASFYSMDKIPLSDWTMIGKLAPFFTLFFSSIILKERVGGFQKICMLLSIIGSVFIIKPSFSNVLLIPSLFCLSDAILSGVAYTYVRMLGLKGVPSTLIVFYFSLSSTLLTAPFAILNYKHMEIKQFAMLVFAAISGAMTQFMLTNAYKNSPAREISVYEYSQVIFAALLGYVFLSQIPDYMSLLGYLIIFLSALMMFVRQKKHIQ